MEHKIYGWLIGRVAFEDAESFPPTSRYSRLGNPSQTARVAQPLRFGQIGFAPLQFGGPFRHLRLEFVAGSAKLSLALAYRFLGAEVIVHEACRPKCRRGMVGGHGEQQLIDFGGKVGAITGRSNQTTLGIDADGNDNAAASLRATADVTNDFPARQAAVDGEMMLQPFRKCAPMRFPA